MKQNDENNNAFDISFEYDFAEEYENVTDGEYRYYPSNEDINAAVIKFFNKKLGLTDYIADKIHTLLIEEDALYSFLNKNNVYNWFLEEFEDRAKDRWLMGD